MTNLNHHGGPSERLQSAPFNIAFRMSDHVGAQNKSLVSNVSRLHIMPGYRLLCRNER